MITRKYHAALIALCGFLLSGIQAQAATLQLCGPAICYEFDNNAAGGNPGVALYGLPVLLGNSDTLKFSPSSFDADSDLGSAIPTPGESATFVFSRIFTRFGGEVGTISIAEDGDYQIIGDASVSANLVVRINDLVDDGPGFGSPFSEQITDSQWFATSTPTGGPLANWHLASVLSPAAVFSDLASSVDLSIENHLMASAGVGGGYAYIAKKLLLTVSAAVVPVPAAFWLAASALALLGGLRRRTD